MTRNEMWGPLNRESPNKVQMLTPDMTVTVCVMPGCRQVSGRAAIEANLLRWFDPTTGAGARGMKKRDLAFVALCLAGAVLCGTWSVKLGVDFYRSHQAPTDLSSSHRQGK